jgi:HEAT repeat protein
MVSLAALLQDDGLPLGLRGQAMAAFALSRDPSVAVLFRQFLTSPSSDVTRMAAFGSGVIQDTKSIEHLEALFNLSDTFARRTACLALAAIGTTQALEIVATSLLRGDEDLRRAAAEALSNHPGEGTPC